MADKSPKTVSVRLTEDAVKWAKIATGYTGEAMAEYVSRVVTEAAVSDADRLRSQVTRPGTVSPKTSTKKGE